MQDHPRNKGPWIHRFLTVVFTAIFAVLWFWLLGFVVDDIGTWILGFTKSCADCKQNFLSVDAFNEWKLEHMQMFKEWKRGRDGPGGLWEAINKLRERMKI